MTKPCQDTAKGSHNKAGGRKVDGTDVRGLRDLAAMA